MFNGDSCNSVLVLHVQKSNCTADTRTSWLVMAEYLACSALRCRGHWELPLLPFDSCWGFSPPDIWSCYKIKSQDRIDRL